ncbi:DUF4190 domain-containing protein [Streptomyces sp. enrichment culture]|uniref:DUF4190 domain-containing protein n=1 Tax=Streptomyces sp. enrichment culture TaxID=1795815 RepID=UPI003F54BAA2
MTDATQPGGGPAGGNDPWAPPEHRTSLTKGDGTGAGQSIPGTPSPAGGQGGAQPPSVHDQPTVVSMPAVGPTPPGATPPGGSPFGPPGGAVPPPPPAPTGPGAAVPPGGFMGPGGPSPHGYPGYPQGYGWTGMPLPPQNGAGTAAMVLGILACCMFCAYGVVSVVLGALAIVFGIKGRRKAAEGLADNHGQAQAGLITGIIGLVLGLAVMTLLIVSIVIAVNSEDDSYQDDEYYYGVQRPAATAPAVLRGA